ncbi:Pimeloyl-ACP methyl ester carboxylesterase [Salinihabitans flavidus]|uniref:Pimeloyl-ACP methyl ester carboxylesterase n=1 Tax=Salinihabitans flavidus TaxID=569882 RepID=A0A1H8SG06_9RHOB|nr:alpha/beta hydrolase [Salinihabitans flavidus]SEO77959.1 Pimeloyl-ACP methyl ester carboxylesterase [Salinihabitans flavidus]
MGDGIFEASFGSGPRQALALHCSLAHSGAWRGVAECLGDEMTLRCIDLPGHGRSAPCPPEEFPDRAYAAALARLDGPVDLIGHSFGAVLALRLALERPDRVRSLLLFEPVLMAAAADDPDLLATNGALMEEVARHARAGDPEMGARLFMRVWGDGTPWDTLPEELTGRFTGGMGYVLAAQAVLSDDIWSLLVPGRLEGLRLPALMADGEMSPGLMPEVMDRLAARIPCARRETLPGAGHMGPITHAAEFAAAIRRTLAPAEAG